MTAVLELGTWVALADGREGQVWVEPHPDDLSVLVATGAEFVKARQDSVTVVQESGLVRHPKSTNQTARIVKARLAHDCGCERGHSAAGHACIGIKPGGQYVRTVLFPGGTNSTRKPWVMRLCLPCARSYDSTDPARLAVKS